MTHTDEELLKMWHDGDDVPIDDEERIEESWIHFEVGTYRDEIWNWFDEQHSKGLYVLMGLE